MNESAYEVVSNAWKQEQMRRERKAQADARSVQAAKRRARAREENAARTRLAKSVIPKWFPNVDWEYYGTYAGKDLWFNGSGPHQIRLAVFQHSKDGNGDLRVGYIHNFDEDPYSAHFVNSLTDIAALWRLN